MKAAYFSVAGFLLLLNGCTTPNEIQQSWTAPSSKTDTTKVFQKILFVALLKDDPARRITEDKLVEAVNGRGVASYKYLPGLDTRASENVVADRLRQDGFDGVVVMRLASADKNATYVSGSYPDYYNSWYGYYTFEAPRYNDPGTYPIKRSYNIETTVYSLTKNQLLWTGIASAGNITDTRKMADNIIATIKQRMKSQGLIK